MVRLTREQLPFVDRLTAEAIRSPLGSEDRGVACPRVVEGDAAQMASIYA